MDVFIGVYISLSAIFFFWLGKTISTLRKTVEAQASTIDAFKSLNSGMKALLDSTDEPAMLERMKAYREILDHEMEVKIKKLEGEKQKDLAQLKGASQDTLNKVLDRYQESNSTALTVAGLLLAYVPPEKRDTVIGTMDFGKEKWMKEVLVLLAGRAPYNAPGETISSKDFWRATLKFASPKKD